MLTRADPEVALSLLERYFTLDDRFDDAQAYVDRANAYISLSRFEDAVSSYEAALSREEEFPNLKTQAYVELPYLISLRSLEAHYERALQVLQAYQSRLLFPVDHFKWHAASALIAVARKDNPVARKHARNALDSASKDHSGFRYHPTIGLISDAHNDALQRLRGLCDS